MQLSLGKAVVLAKGGPAEDAIGGAVGRAVPVGPKEEGGEAGHEVFFREVLVVVLAAGGSTGSGSTVGSKVKVSDSGFSLWVSGSLGGPGGPPPFCCS